MDGLVNNHEGKQRIIQEFVPGKQTTMAHMIANPKEDLYTKLGVITDNRGALGIMTITPSEAAIIGADVATKAAAVDIVFVDRFSGTVILTGTVSEVEESLAAITEYMQNKLGFTVCEVTKT